MNNAVLSDISLNWLFVSLIILLLLSAFFSGSETSMMSLNRYKLKYLAKSNKNAKRTNKLLARPDRLLGIILIGNNFVNISASAIATLIGANLLGDIGIIIATITLTIVILIFSEVLPKTLGAIKPERIAFLAALPLQGLLWLLFPLVWLTNCISNATLRLFNITVQRKNDSLSLEELRSVVAEASSLIPSRHQEMLTRILDLEKMTIDDIMIPRTEVYGIDLEDEIQTIIAQLSNTQYTLLPVFRGDLEDVAGIIHMRDISRYLANADFNIDFITQAMHKPYFVPEGTPLHQQLINFQHNKMRLGLVVDEYGDIQGLVTLEDILEEIVGEFTTDITTMNRTVYPAEDGGFIVDGSANIRALNRTMRWELPTTSAKTLSGIITEYLETIPEHATCVLLNRYPIEVMQVQDNMIKAAKVFARLPEKM